MEPELNLDADGQQTIEVEEKKSTIAEESNNDLNSDVEDESSDISLKEGNYNFLKETIKDIIEDLKNGRRKKVSRGIYELNQYCESVDELTIGLDWYDCRDDTDVEWKIFYVMVAVDHEELHPKLVDLVRWELKEHRIHMVGDRIGSGDDTGSVAWTNGSNVTYVNHNKGPKMKHIIWKGGNFEKWIEFADNYKDMAEEHCYDDKTGILRLKRFTGTTRENALIKDYEREEKANNSRVYWRLILDTITENKLISEAGKQEFDLKDLKQGNDTLEVYYGKFQQGIEKSRLIGQHQYTRPEIVEIFEKSLNDELKRVVWNTDLNRESIHKYVKGALDVESKTRRLGVLKYKKTDQFGGYKNKKSGSYPKNQDKKSLSTICYGYLFGKCKFGGECTRSHNLKDAPVCKFDGNTGGCSRKDCKFKHPKNGNGKSGKSGKSFNNDSKSANNNKRNKQSSENTKSGKVQEITGIEEIDDNCFMIVDSEDDDEFGGACLMNRMDNKDVGKDSGSDLNVSLKNEMLDRSILWFDTGCSGIQTNNLEHLSFHKDLGSQGGRTTQADGKSSLSVTGEGIMAIRCFNSGKVLLLRTLLIPDLGYTLIGNSRFDNKAKELSFQFQVGS